MARSRFPSHTTENKAQKWETTNPLLKALYDEFKELSKKKPDGAVSEGKITLVNRLLSECEKVLDTEPTAQFLDTLEIDDVIQYSDVVLVLSQWRTAMNDFRVRYFDYPDWRVK